MSPKLYINIKSIKENVIILNFFVYRQVVEEEEEVVEEKEEEEEEEEEVVQLLTQHLLYHQVTLGHPFPDNLVS